MILSKQNEERLKQMTKAAITGGERLQSGLKYPLNQSSHDSNHFDIEDIVLCDVQISHFNQKSVKKAMRHISDKSIVDLINHRENGLSIMDIAILHEYCPYNLAKKWLEHLSHERKVSINSVSKFLENPKVIEDEILRLEILECICNDPVNSHRNNQIRDVFGKMFEDHLYEKMKVLKMVFETEDDLRNKGQSKTPDALLSIPMALVAVEYSRTFVQHSLNGSSLSFHSLSPHSVTPLPDSLNSDNLFPMSKKSGPNFPCVVNWIDSKALFADVDTLTDHSAQFKEYINRYGRGLVIYWHGFVEDVVEKAFQMFGDMVIVSHYFPEEWIFPSNELANGDAPVFFRN